MPASGAWHTGDPPGQRRFLSLFTRVPLFLETGGSLSPVTIAYETWGRLNASRSNAVLVLHALTGDSHATGPPGPGHSYEGWWKAVIGPGKPIDTDRFFVVCPNTLGGCQGTTGPSSLAPDGSPYGSRFPRITIRDQTRVEAALTDTLDIPRWAGVVGGSMGGMRVLEWAVGFPERVERAVVIASTAAASAEQIALSSAQIQAIRTDPQFSGGNYYDAPSGQGPHRGIALARTIAQISYRSEPEMHTRFGRGPQADENPLQGGRYAVQSYLDYHGEKLARRFDANTYVVLSEAMNHHDIGRDREGITAALAHVQATVTIGGISSDRLYPLHQQEELASLLPANTELIPIASPNGHDGFLIEHEAVGKILHNALSRPT